MLNTSGLFRVLLVAFLSVNLSAGFDEDDLGIPNAFWWHPGGHKNASNTTKPNSCASFTSCNSCNDASWCHWCEGDQACHAVGSIHGCIRGSDCQPPPPPPPPNNDSCAAHSNCANCTKHSSHLCHWCAHDNACHAIGSVYGCVAGVDCYSNDRCQRRDSEPIIPANATDNIMEEVAMSISQIGFFPLMVFAILTLSCVCCVSLCFCVSSGFKGAYDDLLTVYHDRDEEPEQYYTSARPPPAQSAQVEDAVENAVEEGNTNEYVQLGDGSEHSDDEEGDNHDHVNHIGSNGAGNQLSTPLLLVQRRHRPAPRHMQRLFNYCRLCYVLSLLTIIGCTMATILYYPKIPSYNVCNDAVAWGSLIDSLTNMKATADFEILISVSNPNHFALALDKGMGSFTHKGAFVGTYDIPPVVAAPMAITDLLIVAHLAPDKWDALGLVAEYYRGKLVLYVDAEATLRIPMLANYSFTSALKNIVVNVNEQSERYLCACPNWNEVRLGDTEMGGEVSAGAFLQIAPPGLFEDS